MNTFRAYEVIEIHPDTGVSTVVQCMVTQSGVNAAMTRAEAEAAARRMHRECQKSRLYTARESAQDIYPAM